MGPLHRLLRTVLSELFLTQAGDDDRQLVGGQPVRVMEYGGDRQILAADRAVDDDLQALDRGKDVDRSPVAARPVHVEYQHQIIASDAFFFASFSIWRR